MKDLDPAGLDCLAALADERSFERAAETLAITQSATSQRLRSLEAQVGQLLVVRSRPLRLTEAGKLLLRYARQLQALRADALRELGAPASGHRLPIAINADSLATWFAPALVYFHDMKPLDAMKASFAAGAKNWLAMCIFGIFLLVALFFAMLPVAMGLLLFLPVFSGAVYASYRDIFMGS